MADDLVFLLWDDARVRAGLRFDHWPDCGLRVLDLLHVDTAILLYDARMGLSPMARE